MILSEGIRISKGAVINITKRTMPFTELAPEEISQAGGKKKLLDYARGIIVTKKRNCLICEYQETLMGDIMKLQDTI